MHRLLHSGLIIAVAAGLLAVGQETNAEPGAVAPVPSTYTALSPVRVLDTRNGGGPVGAGGTTTLDLATRVPTTATAVVLTVTGVTPTANTYVTAYPGGTARPTASSLNLAPGDIRANQVTVALGTNRRVDLYNHDGSVHIVADLAGYYATGSGARFTALPPNRVLDTRESAHPPGPGGTVVLDLANLVPASATAITFNLTGTGPSTATHVTAYPTGTPLPTASNLNLPAGDTRANLVTVAVGADRKVSLYNHNGSVHILADLTGFYTPDYGASFVPLAPSRVLDTRDGTGGTTGPLGPGQNALLDLMNTLPPTATGVVLNITGVDATAATFVTAYSRYELRPHASTLNLSPGQTVPNAAMVAFTRVPAMLLYNNVGNVHLIADLSGVFAVLDPACTAGCVHAWGDNFYKKLGTGETVVDSPVPSPVAGLSGVRAVSGGGSLNAYALRDDGTVWAWGANYAGQLGNGWFTTIGLGAGSATPVPVVGLTRITAIAGTEHGAYALRDDGTVWAWGQNDQGQLGNGTLDDSSVPVRVTGLTDVIAVGGRVFTGYALRADGTVWAWGDNTAGALGNDSAVQYSTVPVQVSGLTGITAVSAGDLGAYALRGDGTVWAWGNNKVGQLGNGQPCDPSVPCMSGTPVQVSGLTDVVTIAGSREGAYAARVDGTVWAWGTNRTGQLGNGVECSPFEEVCESRVPVRVSGLTDVTRLAAFDFGGYALRADGSVWAWGSDQHHALGNGSEQDSPVPVPVTGVSGASAVAGGWLAGYVLAPTP